MKNQDIELCADIMFVQQQVFLVTVSKHIKFHTIVPINNRNKLTLCEAFDQTFRVYNKGGFNIATLHIDPEFNILKDYMMDIDNGIELAPVSAQQHVPDIERAICIIKGMIQSFVS